jgi:hypothetical protein
MHKDQPTTNHGLCHATLQVQGSGAHPPERRRTAERSIGTGNIAWGIRTRSTSTREGKDRRIEEKDVSQEREERGERKEAVFKREERVRV